MRKIKFRSWDYNSKSMVYLNELKVQNGEIEYLLTMDKNGEMFVIWQQVTDIPGGKLESSGGLNNLMQYTGLNDKNGKEIYEGDIFKDADGSLFKVSYDVEELIYIVNCIGEDYSWNISRFKTDEFEVIGNIYENPELLKGE